MLVWAAREALNGLPVDLTHCASGTQKEWENVDLSICLYSFRYEIVAWPALCNQCFEPSPSVQMQELFIAAMSGGFGKGTSPYLTTNAGAPVYNDQQSLTVGARRVSASSVLVQLSLLAPLTQI